MTVNELIESLKELQKRNYGDYTINSYYCNDFLDIRFENIDKNIDVDHETKEIFI